MYLITKKSCPIHLLNTSSSLVYRTMATYCFSDEREIQIIESKFMWKYTSDFSEENPFRGKLRKTFVS